MYDRTRTRLAFIEEYDVATGETITEEGMPLIRTIESGTVHAHPGTNDANATFLGWSMLDSQSYATTVDVEDLTVPAAPGPYTLTLQHSNLVGTAPNVSIRVYDVTALADLTQAMAISHLASSTRSTQLLPPQLSLLWLLPAARQRAP